MSEYRSVLERAGSKAPAPDLPVERVFRRRDRRHRNQRIMAGVVGFAVFLGAILLVTSGGPFDRGQTTSTPGGGETGPSVTGPPEPTVSSETSGIVGLPLEGATPSAPERGQLVLYLEGDGTGPWTAVWIYADGRVIWGDAGAIESTVPAGAPTEGATGFVEQHLTSDGVEFLQSQVLSTGLFESDLTLLRGADEPGFLTVEARNGDRLVQVTWAWHGIVGKDAPSETAEQAIALEGVHSLLSDPTSWPARAWEDESVETFVPSRYQVWLRLLSDTKLGTSRPVGAPELALLPAAAADLLGNATEVDRAFYEMTTDEMRAFAGALEAPGVESLSMPNEEAVLRYRIWYTDDLEYSLFVFVGPVLPHGEAFFLGPG